MEPEVVDVALPGVRLSCLAWGPADGPLGVARHGFPDTAGTWRHHGPHLAGRSDAVRATFAAFLALLEENGPVTVLPEKTRIAFQVRMSFAQLTLRKEWALGHLVLARRVEDEAFTRVETFSPRNHLHAFRLDGPDEAEKLRPWTPEAYAVGCQDHLGRDADQP